MFYLDQLVQGHSWIFDTWLGNFQQKVAVGGHLYPLDPFLVFVFISNCNDNHVTPPHR